jgi:4-amino-4-deoxy-L-arabinose transferase-like glycosyltransferase
LSYLNRLRQHSTPPTRPSVSEQHRQNPSISPGAATISPTSPSSGPATRLAAQPGWLLWLLFFAAIALGHWTLLRLPYYWDEGGYYIPAALDFFHTGTLIPQFTNAHPPLPNVLLGTLWHLVGFHILATRLAVCAVAAAALLAIFRLTQRLVGPAAAIAVTLLTAVYPIWYTQSTLAHADIFAAAFTLWAFEVYFSSSATGEAAASSRRLVLTALLFSLAALSKETAIVEPAALAAFELFLFIRTPDRRNHLRWLAALSFPVIPLAAWFAYHHARTGFTFGNPTYLRYNATANFTVQHVLMALRFRFAHLFWQRNIWLPIVLALACLFLPERPAAESPRLTPRATITIGLLVAANWIAFSVLGGALLTRYLLPIYPLILLTCVAIWQSRTRHWPWLAAVSAAVLLSGLWINPPTAFAPEDNLTYRDMIVVHQQAIDFVAQHFPDATVLTAWPVAADLVRPELGYTTHPIKTTSVDDFTLADLQKAAQDPGSFDTAIVFTTHYASPTLLRYWATHPNTLRGREFAGQRDLTPKEVAAMLGGTIVWHNDIDGEWAAVLRFNRSYNAQLLPHVPAQ